jgi:PadR family transcriptional regulator AphA
MKKTNNAILGMLSIEPMSGYEIRQVMQQSTANFWCESDGQLYPALTQLTKLGLVLCKKDKTSAREKKIYHITAKGLEELKKWLELSPETFLIRNEFMLKLFFGANVSPTRNLEHLQAHRYQTKTMLTELINTKKKLAEEHKDSVHFPYWQMSIQYGISLAEAKLQWCDDVIKQLKKMNRGEKS